MPPITSRAALLALTLLAAPTWGQLEPNSEPESLGPLGGSDAPLVVDPSDSDVALLIRYGIGLQRTTDGGDNWSSLGVGLSAQSAPIPNDPILSGIPVCAQLGVADPGAAHPSGRALTDGLRITLID